ncbi:MAG: hypothetical protein Q9195_005825 [Heterodermia aff. obscurata]
MAINQHAPANITTKAAPKSLGNASLPNDTATAPIPQRQTLRVFAFSTQASWTPEAIAGIIFGVLMFLLGVIAVWQTQNRKLVFVRDVESRFMLPAFPTARVFQTDPDLWVPPYEPPQDFVCIADPPDSYANADIKTLTRQDLKKPAPKPEPKPKPPQPRDGYDVGTVTDMLPNTEGNRAWMLGGTGSENPEPKPKPPQPRDGYNVETGGTNMPGDTEGNDIWMLGGTGPKKPDPKPKPQQPRDGYDVETDLTDMLPDTAGNAAWMLGGTGPKKPEPKPKPPQPRDGYRDSPSSTAWMLGGSDSETLQPADAYQVEAPALASSLDDHKSIFSWLTDLHLNKALVI